MKADAKDLLKRKTWPWRAAFVLYALTLTTATHWPSLDVGGDSFESPDKLIHMLAFAVLFVLLWRTRWIARAWQAGVIVLVWAVVDEVTQSVPILHRVFSGQDLAAGQLGVVVTLVWFWALAPIGGPANRARIAWQWFLIDDLFARPGMWVVCALAGAGGAAIIGGVTWFILRSVTDLDTIIRTSRVVPSSVMLGGFAGGAGAGLAAVVAGVGRRAAAIRDSRPCLSCGHGCRDVAVDAEGRGQCAACGAAFHAGQWAAPMQLPLKTLKLGLGRATLTAIGILLAVVVMNTVLIELSGSVAPVGGLLRAWNALLPDMRLAVDLGVFAIAIAVAVRVYRGRQALLHDRQHVRCRVCDHDLTGTDVSGGCGRCGECGTPFARFGNG